MEWMGFWLGLGFFLGMTCAAAYMKEAVEEYCKTSGPDD